MASWLVTALEHKRRLPEWAGELVKQARAAAGHNRLGLAVIREGDEPGLCVLSEADFVDWMGWTGTTLDAARLDSRPID